MKRYRGYRIALMCLMLLYICSAAAYADSVVLGGKELIGKTDCTYWIQDGKTIKAEGATGENYNVKYDKQRAELTLRNVQVTESSPPNDGVLGINNTALYIDVNGPISIILEGNNVIGSNTSQIIGTENGIYIHENVSLMTFIDGPGTGTGSLDIYTTKYGIHFDGYQSGGNEGIEFKGGNVEVDVKGIGLAYGIFTEEKGNVIVDGGEVGITAQTTGESKSVYGICCTSLELNNGDVDIHAIGNKKTAYGIQCTSFEMNHGDLSIKAEGGRGKGIGIQINKDPSALLTYHGGIFCVHIQGDQVGKALSTNFTNDIRKVLGDDKTMQGSYDGDFIEIKNKEKPEGEPDGGNNEGSGENPDSGNNEGSGGGSDSGNNEGSGGDLDNGNDEGSEGDSIGGGNEEPDKDQNDRTDEESIDGDVIAALPMTGDQNPSIALLMSVMFCSLVLLKKWKYAQKIHD